MNAIVLAERDADGIRAECVSAFLKVDGNEYHLESSDSYVEDMDFQEIDSFLKRWQKKAGKLKVDLVLDKTFKTLYGVVRLDNAHCNEGMRRFKGTWRSADIGLVQRNTVITSRIPTLRGEKIFTSKLKKDGSIFHIVKSDES